MAAIIAFVVIAASYALRMNPTGASTFGNWTTDGGFAPNGWLPVMTGVTPLIFTLVGAEIATVAEAKVKESEKVIANLTAVLIFRILFFYVGAIALIVAVVPWREIAVQAQVQLMSPFTMALDRVGIPGAGMVIDIIVLVAVLSCLNSGVYAASRVLFTLAAKKVAPMWIVQVDRRGVPSHAILVGAAIACAAVTLKAFFPKEIFGFLINASGALMISVYMLVVGSHLVLRPKIPKANLHLATWFYPFSGWIVIAAMAAVLVAMAVTKGRDAEPYASLTCLAVIVAANFIFRRGRVT